MTIHWKLHIVWRFTSPVLPGEVIASEEDASFEDKPPSRTQTRKVLHSLSHTLNSLNRKAPRCIPMAVNSTWMFFFFSLLDGFIPPPSVSAIYHKFHIYQWQIPTPWCWRFGTVEERPRSNRSVFLSDLHFQNIANRGWSTAFWMFAETGRANHPSPRLYV